MCGKAWLKPHSGAHHQLLLLAFGANNEQAVFYPQGNLGDIWVSDLLRQLV